MMKHKKRQVFKNDVHTFHFYILQLLRNDLNTFFLNIIFKGKAPSE